MQLEQLLRRLDHVTGPDRSGWYTARCPAHDDQKPSLRISSDGRVVKCMAGCSREQVFAALGLEDGAGELVATYDYRDADGKLLYQVLRYQPKRFVQRRPDGKGGWIWDLQGVQTVLYRLPEVLAAVRGGEQVFVVEGEKDADNLAALGLVATTNPGGAGKWRDSYSQALRGAKVVLVPDRDEPGRRHAQQVARALRGVAASVRVLDLPGDGKDVSDWLAAGGTREQLLALAAAAQEYKPPGGRANQKPLVIETSEAFMAGADEPTDWLVEGLVARGAITLLAAAPKAGKTTFAAGMIQAMLTGQPFLGLATRPAKILYLTEERRDTLRKRWQAVGLQPHPDLRVIRRGLNPQPIDLIMAQVVEEVKAGRCDLVVVDTIGAWWGVLKENEAGIVQRAMDVLAKPAQAGAAVLLVHHRRKVAGTEPGEGVRGSSALAGAVDIVLEMGRPRREGAPPNVRELYGIGRYDDVPENLAYELRDGRLEALGSVQEWANKLLRDRVLEAVRRAPEGLTTREAAEAASVNVGTVVKLLGSLVQDGLITVTGTGKRGDPKRYVAVCYSDSSVSSETGNPHGSYVKSEETISRLNFLTNGNYCQVAGESEERKDTEESEETEETEDVEYSSSPEMPITTTFSASDISEETTIRGDGVTYYPPRRADGACSICGAVAWRAAKGQQLCSRCFAVPAAG